MNLGRAPKKSKFNEVASDSNEVEERNKTEETDDTPTIEIKGILKKY